MSQAIQNELNSDGHARLTVQQLIIIRLCCEKKGNRELGNKVSEALVAKQVADPRSLLPHCSPEDCCMCSTDDCISM